MMRWEVVSDTWEFKQSDTIRLRRTIGQVEAGRKGVIAAIDGARICVFVPERQGVGNIINMLQVSADDIELTELQEPWHELLA